MQAGLVAFASAYVLLFASVLGFGVEGGVAGKIASERTQIQSVHYRGESPMWVDLAGGQIQAALTCSGDGAMTGQVTLTECQMVNQFGGSATRLDFLGEDRVDVTGARYSGCRPDPVAVDAQGRPRLDWVLEADRLRLDFGANEGIAEGAALRFLDVPILAMPVLSFPLTSARKSGWLPPGIDVANTSGLEVSVPYYWNIAPQADATITPYVSTRRGASFDGERLSVANQAGLERFVDELLDAAKATVGKAAATAVLEAIAAEAVESPASLHAAILSGTNTADMASVMATSVIQVMTETPPSARPASPH